MCECPERILGVVFSRDSRFIALVQNSCLFVNRIVKDEGYKLKPSVEHCYDSWAKTVGAREGMHSDIEDDPANLWIDFNSVRFEGDRLTYRVDRCCGEGYTARIRVEKKLGRGARFQTEKSIAL